MSLGVLCVSSCLCPQSLPSCPLLSPSECVVSSTPFFSVKSNNSDSRLWSLGCACSYGSKSVCWAFGETRPLAPSLQFQTELRKILLSLIEVAQKLLALSPGAVELFTKANGTRKPGGRRDPRADPVSSHLWGQSLRLLPFAPWLSALKLEKSGLLCTWMPSELLVPQPCSDRES